MSQQEEKKLVKHAFKAKQSQYSNRCKETWSWERTKEGSVHLCAFMCIYVHLCVFMCIYVYLCVFVWVWKDSLCGFLTGGQRGNQMRSKRNQNNSRQLQHTHLYSSAEPEGNTHLHTFFDLLSLNLDVWFSFRLWGFFAFWQSFSFRQTDGAWSHKTAVQMFGGSVGQTRGCGWQARLTDKSNTRLHLGYKWIPSTKEKNIKVQI